MSETPRPPRNNKAIARTVWFSVVIIFLGTFVTLSYLRKLNYERENPRLPRIRPIRKDLSAMNRDGMTVQLSELKGKIYLAAIMHTGCPKHCARLAEAALEADKAYPNDPRFNVVFFAGNPAGETAEALNQWAAENGAADTDWWILLADPEEIKKYVVQQFQFTGISFRPENAAHPETGLLRHDDRVALVDHNGDIRGYYFAASANPEESAFERKRLQKNIQTLLDELPATP